MPPFSGNSFDTVTGTFYANGQPIWKGADQMYSSVSDHTGPITINTETISNIGTSISGRIDCSGFISARDFCDIVYEQLKTEKEAEKEAEKKPEPEKELEPAIYLPVLDNYWKQGDSLVVKWTDGTITIVTAEDPERATLYAGICIAFAKKVLGSTTAMAKQIETVQKKKDWPRRRREIIKERMKELKKAKREIDAEIRENRIRKEMEDILIHQEAANRAFDKTLKEARAKHADFDKDKEKLDSDIAKAIMFGDAQEDNNK